MIKVILWDIDATLLDFDIAEKEAFYKCFEVLGVDGCNDEWLEIYANINRTYWQRLERNEITKEEVLIGRYIEFFSKMNIVHPKLSLEEFASAFNDEYQIRLGDTCVFRDDSLELVKSLKGKYKQYIVTNGTAIAQHRKLKNSTLETIMDGYFISDEIGVEKPNKGFFDAVWKEIGHYKKDEAIIIGDSLTSDMRGGNNANITCCWYNPKNKINDTKDVVVDFEIKDLREIPSILDRLNK